MVDYRKLYGKTLKNHYPLSSSQDTLIQHGKARWYTNLDVCNPYNLLCITPGDEYEMTFRTRDELFDSLVMLFALITALASFQTFINDTLAMFLNRYVTAYPDDILINSDTLNEHRVGVGSVLEKFSGAGLHLKPEKFEFRKEEVKHLVLIIGRGMVMIDTDKMVVVQGWLLP